MMTREEELYRALQAAWEHHMLDAVGNMKLLNHSGSPVFDPWENLAPLLVLTIGSLALLLVYKLLVGTLALVASTMIYLFVVRPWMAARLHTRLVNYLFSDIEKFKALWRMGGVSLAWTGYPPDFCHSPKGDWQKFAERHAKPLALPEGEEGEEEDLGIDPREERRGA